MSCTEVLLLDIVIDVGFGLPVRRCWCVIGSGHFGDDALRQHNWQVPSLEAGMFSCYFHCSETVSRKVLIYFMLFPFATREENVFIRLLCIWSLWLGNLSCCINNCGSLWAWCPMAHPGSGIFGEDLHFMCNYVSYWCLTMITLVPILSLWAFPEHAADVVSPAALMWSQ